MERRSKRALILCGGGISGAYYEVGVLKAIEEFIEPAMTINDFDLFIGTSAGASIAAFLVQGIRAERLYSALENEDDPYFPISRERVYKFDLLGWARTILKLKDIRRKHWYAYSSLIKNIDISEEVSNLINILPSGIFTLEPYEKFLSKTFESLNLTNNFLELKKKLLITANDIDTAERVVFGEEPYTNIPISKAIIASSAIPVFFKPVRINGRDFIDGGTANVAHLGLAVRYSCRSVIIINPIVPIINDGKNVCFFTDGISCANISDMGMFHIYNQAIRMATTYRLKQAIRKHSLKYKDLRISLFEPQDSQLKMFIYNPLSFENCREILKISYEDTKKFLEHNYRHLYKTLGISKRKR
ncbi:MAG: patatin-like phospholipase family protein [Deltaproteobacteria bacterium]|nr:patatin-like phospholipase family protein [Deltaproteobacteria bacterium]